MSNASGGNGLAVTHSASRIPHDDMILEVRNLKKYFPVRRGLFSRVTGHVRAVDDVSFFIKKGETLALVGESGCGKTTLGRTILSLYDATAGRITFAGRDVTATDRLTLRGGMQAVFQDPYGSLNPRMTVGGIIEEGLRVHKTGWSAARRRDAVAEILAQVGLAAEHYNRYPHEFSGGQRQRIGIARAVVMRPQFVVCDEPVSALDLSVQAKILNLLLDLKDIYDLSYLFIAHDLSVVKHIADRVAVLYLGRLAELADTETLYNDPKHPYTQVLLRAAPALHPDDRGKREVPRGDVPSPLNPPPGCPYHPRCPHAKAICKQSFPGDSGGGGRKLHCHLYTNKC